MDTRRDNAWRYVTTELGNGVKCIVHHAFVSPSHPWRSYRIFASKVERFLAFCLQQGKEWVFWKDRFQLGWVLSVNSTICDDKRAMKTIYCFIKCSGIQLTLVCAHAGKIGLFYLIFYGFIGGLFAVHLMLFACNLPPPDPGMRPRNFGRFAYPNFPNSPLSKHTKL